MNDKEKILELIENVDYPMLVTQAGGLMARPMKTVNVAEDGVVSFFTIFDTNKVDSILEDQDVLVIFNDSTDNNYVSAQGIATISFDKTMIKEYWSLVDKAFFSEGLKTEGLCIVNVHLTHVECWNTQKNIFQIALDVAFSLQDGKKASVGEQISTNFSQ